MMELKAFIIALCLDWKLDIDMNEFKDVDEISFGFLSKLKLKAKVR